MLKNLKCNNKELLCLHNVLGTTVFFPHKMRFGHPDLTRALKLQCTLEPVHRNMSNRLKKWDRKNKFSNNIQALKKTETFRCDLPLGQNSTKLILQILFRSEEICSTRKMAFCMKKKAVVPKNFCRPCT